MDLGLLGLRVFGLLFCCVVSSLKVMGLGLGGFRGKGHRCRRPGLGFNAPGSEPS